MSSVSGSESPAPNSRRVKDEIAEVDPSEVAQVLGEGVPVIDIRESEELEQGKLPGAVARPAQLPRDAHRRRRP